MGIEREQLEQAIAALEAQRDALGDAVVEAALAPLREKLAALEMSEVDGQSLAGERKRVTVMFADISGFTPLSERLDPEVVRDLVNACFEHLVPVVERYEGTIDKFMGDNVMALFGAPVAHEDDPERALRAALDMKQALAQFSAQEGLELGLHFGINTGLVIAGGLGTRERQEYSVMGDAVNLASRLEDLSEPGEILVGLDTYRLTATLFEFEALEPVRVKGKAEPVRVYRLVGLKARAERVRDSEGLESPLVGREAECASLAEALACLQLGVGGIVTIVGEAGIGKSRLMAEVGAAAGATHLESASHLTWVEGRCLAYGSSMTYHLWLDVLRGLLGVTPEDPPEDVRDRLRERVQALCPDRSADMFPYLGRLMSLPLPSGDEAALHDLEGETLKSRTFQAMERLVASAAQQRPLVVVCEDLHWADPTSVELLEHLLALTDRVPLLYVTAFRPEREHGSWRLREAAARDYPHRHTDLWLRRLSASESAILVNKLLGVEDLHAGLRAEILRHAEGNPFFVEEILRSLIDSGAIAYEEAAGRWLATRDVAGIEIPDTLHGVLVARIDRLPEETKRVLQRAAVIGRVFLYRVLAVMGEDERGLERHLLALQQEGMIRERARLPEREYIFKHHLTQEAAYNGLLKAERCTYHRRVAEALEALFPGRVEEQVSLLAHHYQKAGDFGLAFRYLTLAAERASRLYANDDAIAHYTRAIEVAERVSPDAVSLAKLHRGRGLAREMLGEFDGARADHKAVLRIARAAHAPRVEWRALLDLGKLWASRDYQRARGYFERALELARRMDDPAALADSLNWMGNWHVNAENSLTAVAYHQEALEIVEELGDQRDLANTLDLLALAYELGGNLTASVRTYDRAIALCRELGDRPRLVTSLIARSANVSMLVMLVSVPAIAPPDALCDFEAALRIAREIDSAADEAWAHWAVGLLHTIRGRFGPALEVMQSGLRIASTLGHREYEMINRSCLGILYIELLAPEQALRQLEGALTLAGELRSQLHIHWVTGVLAGAYLALDDLTGARTCLGTVLSEQTPMDTLFKRYCWARRAELALAQGESALALDITDRLIASAPGMSPGRVITHLWWLKGAALAAQGNAEGAHTLLQAAAENARATGERFLLWRLHASLGRLYSAMGRQSAAEKEMSTARELVEELADTVPNGEVRDSFLQRAHERLGLSP